MNLKFYSDDAEGRRQQETDQLDELGDTLEELADMLETALAPMAAQQEARDRAKAEYYESDGHWPTDDELNRSGIPIRPLPPLPDWPSD